MAILPRTVPLLPRCHPPRRLVELDPRRRRVGRVREIGGGGIALIPCRAVAADARAHAQLDGLGRAAHR